MGRHAVTLGHIIQIPRQPVFTLTDQYCVFSAETTNTNVTVTGTLMPPNRDASTLTIALPTKRHIQNSNVFWMDDAWRTITKNVFESFMCVSPGNFNC
jgi:hypothetical protein